MNTQFPSSNSQQFQQQRRAQTYDNYASSSNASGIDDRDPGSGDGYGFGGGGDKSAVAARSQSLRDRGMFANLVDSVGNLPCSSLLNNKFIHHSSGNKAFQLSWRRRKKSETD